jgi:CelD/BcsL family acetyltransferase involved in cellulose biosynthesis
MEARPRPAQQRLDTAVLTDAGDFATLEEEWAELYENCPSATPFQSWAWLYSWWEHYGDGYELRLVTVRDSGGLLVGIVPLMLERRWGFGRLLFVGSGITDYLDILATEGRVTAVVEAGVAALERMGGWQVADLQEMRPEATAWALHRGWSASKMNLWQTNSVITDVKPWDRLVASLTSGRRDAKRTLRRAETDGLHPVLVEEADAAKRLIALHREMWRDRGIAPEHTTRTFEAFLETVVGRAAAHELGAISEFRRNREVIASQFMVFGRDFVGMYICGASRETLRRYQVSSLWIWDALNTARDKKIPRLNHMRGEESYKMRWSSRVVPNHRSILGRNAILLAAYTGYHLLRSKTEEYASSENAPRWVARTVLRYRDLRSKAVRQRERMTR